MTPVRSTITACVLARNEALRIEPLLRSLHGRADQILVIDNESTDGTADLARLYADRVLTAPFKPHFQGQRNQAVEHATGEWLLYLDADELPPPAFWQNLRALVEQCGDRYDALELPCRHHFCGVWMQNPGCWPGYKGPQLLRKGRFQFPDRFGEPVRVTGSTLRVPADNPELAIVHNWVPDLRCYLGKLLRDTVVEAEDLRAGGMSCGWEAAMAHFVRDWSFWYDRCQAGVDGMPGFILAVLSGFYGFVVRARLWDLQLRSNSSTVGSSAPASISEAVAFMQTVAREGEAAWLGAGPLPAASDLERTRPEVRLTDAAASVDRGYRPRGRTRITACVSLGDYSAPAEVVLSSLRGWTDRIIVLSPEPPQDAPATIGSGSSPRRKSGSPPGVRGAKGTPGRNQYTTLEVASELDPAQQRTAVAEQLRTLVPDGEWVLFLDPNEAVSSDLARELVRLVRAHADTLDAVFVPSRVRVLGREFTPDLLGSEEVPFPRLVKQGSFRLEATLASGVSFRGRAHYVSEEGKLGALQREGGADVGAYLAYLFREAEQDARHMAAATGPITWRELLSAFDAGWRESYDFRNGNALGMHGLVLSFLAGVRRFLAMALLWDQRRLCNEPQADTELPSSWNAMLGFLADGGAHHRTMSPPKELSQASNDVTDQLAEYRTAVASAALAPLLERVRGLCPDGGRTLELDVKSGFPTVWLSHRGVRAEGLCASPQVVERAGRTNTLLAGRGRFRKSDVLNLEASTGETYDVIFHQDHLHYLSDAEVRRILRQQTSAARWVAFTVPATRRPIPRGRSGERFLTLETWRELLAGFDIESLQYSGDPIEGDRQPLLVVLRGQRPAEPAPVREPTGRREPALEGPPRRLPPNPLLLDPIPASDLGALLGRPLRVRWEGELHGPGAIAAINREVTLRLAESADVELCVALSSGVASSASLSSHIPQPPLERLDAQLSGQPDVTIRHFRSPNWTPPEEGKLVVVVPWEHAAVPETWVPSATSVEEVWVYSRFARDAFVRGGMPAERIRVISPGVDASIFSLGDSGDSSEPSECTRVLYRVAERSDRNLGLLLDAYRRACHAADAVTLVVHDPARLYAGAVRAFQALRGAPAVVYLDQEMPASDLAELYRSVACLVALPGDPDAVTVPLEALACGRPVIVPADGALEDYVDDRVALRVPTRRTPCASLRAGTPIAPPASWSLEPDLDAFADALRWVRDHPEETRERGRAARIQVMQGWTWERTTEMVRARLDLLFAPNQTRDSKSLSSQFSPSLMLERGERGSVTVNGSPSSHPTPVCAARSRNVSSRQVETPLISLCLIARNEEARIGDCLRSAAAYVDEMIVVDTGSIDRTREISGECGARVLQMEWPDSFALARNVSLDAARGRWIFWMDADDVLPPECGERLRSLARSHTPMAADNLSGPGRTNSSTGRSAHPGKPEVAFHVTVRIPPGPGEFSPSLVDHVKLFPNRPDLRFDFRIHEQILPALRRAGIPVEFSDVYVVHQNYDRSPAGQSLKRLRDFRLLELELRERPDHPFVLYNLGMTYLYATQEFEVAAHYLRRCLERSDPSASIVRKAYAMLVTAHLRVEDWDRALSANEAGRSHYPDDAELLFQAGQIYQRVGRMPEAGRSLERLIRGSDDPHYRSVDVSLRTYRGRHELALWFRRVGNLQQSEQLLREIVADQPDYLPAQSDLELLRQKSMRDQSLGQSTTERA